MHRPISFLLASIGMTSIVVQSAFAQTPTEAQQQAIRSSCVSDYRANCSDVQPHEMAALVCLEQHESKLSPACKSTVEAVGGGSSTTESSAPATATATSATDTASASSSEKTAAAAESAKTTSEPTATASPAAPAASGMPEMSFRQEMRIAAHACARDFRLFCPTFPSVMAMYCSASRFTARGWTPPCRNALIAAGVEF